MPLAQVNSYNEFIVQSVTYLLPAAMLGLSVFFWKLYRYFSEPLFTWLTSIYIIKTALYITAILLGEYLSKISFPIQISMIVHSSILIVEMIFYILLLKKFDTLKAIHIKRQQEADNVD